MIADDLLKFTFSGDPQDPIKRHLTGLYSFDHAFQTAAGDIGMPLGTGYEVFGSEATGKSTFCYSLSGLLATQLETNIHIGDLEGFDTGHLAHILHFLGYTGNVDLNHQGKDEDILDKFQLALNGEDYGIGILDSIAAISPIAEKDGDFGGATYGRRAVLIALLSRLLLPTIHPRTVGSEKVYFFINHWYPKVGGTIYQYESPGGKVKNYFFGVQIHLGRSKTFDDGSYILKGTLKKNRYGYNKTEFHVFIKAGVGIHRGLTAIDDCKRLGLLGEGKTVKLGDESFGYISKIIENEWQNEEFFEPFYEALKELK